MSKQIVIKVPDWVDEKFIEDLVNRAVQREEKDVKERTLEELKSLLNELPKSKVDLKKLKELYYEGKMLG